MKGVLFIDAEKCLACRSCEMACAGEHSRSKNLTKAVLETPAPQYRVSVEAAGDVSIPLQCRHCEDAPCVTICPTKALEKLEVGEPVLIKEELCIGCKWCILVCPFGIIKLSRDGRVITKCDLCLERTKEDRRPACVESCPTGALQYRSIEEISREKRKETVRDFLVAFEKSESKKKSKQ